MIESCKPRRISFRPNTGVYICWRFSQYGKRRVKNLTDSSFLHETFLLDYRIKRQRMVAIASHWSEARCQRIGVMTGGWIEAEHQ